MTSISGIPRQSTRRHAILAGVVFCASACANQAPAAPSAPSSDPVPRSRFIISGRLLLRSQTTVEVARVGTVTAWVERPDGPQWFPSQPIGADGRYGIQVPVDTTRVRVFSGGYQPCAVTLDVSGDASADLVIVTDSRLLGGNLPVELRNQGASLSGQVYRTVLGERQAVAGIAISLAALPDPGEFPFPFARTLTDADGRYLLCNVPATGDLVLTVTNDTGGTTVEAYGVSAGVRDIQLRR